METHNVGELVVALLEPAASDREIGWAAALGSALRVPIHLVHVLDPALGYESGDRAEAMATDLAAIAATDTRFAAIEVTYEVRTGLMDEELPALVDGRPGSVLLVGMDDRGLAGRLRGGDRGSLLRRLDAPFILLPTGVVAPRPVVTAVVGDDGSDQAAGLAGLAATFAVDCVTVEAMEPRANLGPEFVQAVPVVSGQRVRVRGRAGQVLAAVARARDAGLIVVGSHGKGQVTRLLLGSTSDWLAHHADRPVLIVSRP